LAALGRATFIESFSGQIEHRNLTSFADERFGSSQQAAELAEPGTVFFVACLGGSAAGYAKVCESVPPSCVNSAKAVELERLYVYSKWHGRGVANILMHTCLGEVRRRGRGGMWLDVWDQNTKAQQFYRKHLFDFVGERAYAVGTETQRHLLMYRPVDLVRPAE
ncbi:MAG: GNAT family N-acetyltransferase, partial [Burkholderiales bacterium]|nr:GNAT family N-acetyltransferase [Burkholderiales bacterium]